MPDEPPPPQEFLRTVLIDALKIGASEVSVEGMDRDANGQNVLVIYRKEDQLINRTLDLPYLSQSALVTVAKIWAKLDISERVQPQSGRAKVKLGERIFDLEVTTSPGAIGERLVILIQSGQ